MSHSGLQNRPQPSSDWSHSLQSVLDQPPATLPGRLILAGMLFSAAFGAWAWFGTIQDVSYAAGRLVPEGKVYKVQPTATGAITRILVQPGDTVKAGQVVAELDQRLARGEVKRLQQALKSDRTQLRHAQEMIDRTLLEAQTQRAIAQSQIQSQTAQLTEARAMAKTQQDLMGQLELDQQAYEERIARLRPLLQEGAIAQEQLFEVEQGWRDRHRNLIQSQGELVRSQAAARRFQAELSTQQAESRRSELSTQQRLQQLKLEVTELMAKIEQTEYQLKIAKTQLEDNRLQATVDGVILSLNVDNTGEVVQPGQTVAEIAPSDAPLVLLASLPDREAGFVRVGMRTQLKFDAFPFQDYGLITGKVISISPDAVVHEQLGAVYQVEISLDQSYVTDENHPIALKAGQTANAEIIVRQRRIIDLLLEPFRKLQRDNLSL